MRKLWISLMFMAALALSACGQQAGGSPTAAGGQGTPTGGAEPQATAFQTTAPTRNPNASVMECQVTSFSPTQGPTEQSIFPPPGEDDWVMGAGSDARLTITEYSDFQ